jgi:hypothetical protein
MASSHNQPDGQTQPLGGRPRFRERLGRGWREANACWDLIARDPYLLILPSLSLVFVLATWIGLILIASTLTGHFYLGVLLAGIVSAYPSSFAGAFLGVAFIAVADGRLQGQHTRVREGLAAARRKAGPIARWALIASGVGLVLQLLQHVKADWAVSAAFAWLAGAAWGVLTFFVVPVLAFEDKGARASLRRSGQIVRDRWGEGIGGVTNIGALGAVGGLAVGLVGVILIGLGYAVGTATGVAALVFVAALFVAMLVVLATAGRLLALGLYRFATGGPQVGFDQEVLQEAGVPKRFRRRRHAA